MLGLLREWTERLDGTDKQKHFFDYLSEQSFNDFLKALSETTISCKEFTNSFNKIKRGEHLKINVSTRKERSEFYNSRDWRELREVALERDHHECVWCREQGRVTTEDLEVDHIKELEFYPEFALDVDNLRTLCKECHNKRHERFQFRKSKKIQEKNFRTDEFWGE